MANSAVVNKLRQVIPLLTLVPPTAEPQLTLLLATQRIVIDTEAIGQDIVDKEEKGYLIVSSTTDALSEGFASFT